LSVNAFMQGSIKVSSPVPARRSSGEVIFRPDPPDLRLRQHLRSVASFPLRGSGYTVGTRST
jgi:hypothetical protein